MTCLYCGKKLGFFSRYKDTPFCSEEHLREHQTELEKALIDRLGGAGSKHEAQALARTAKEQPKTEGIDLGLRSTKSGSAPTTHEASSKRLQSLSDTANSGAEKTASPGLTSEPAAAGPGTNRPASRERQALDSNPGVQLPKPLSEIPVDAAAFGDNAPKRKQVEYAPDPPLTEQLFANPPLASEDLRIHKPWMSPSTFAIIVQADCCVPPTPTLQSPNLPPIDEEGFEIELAPFPWSKDQDGLRGQDGGDLQVFGEAWVYYPESSNSEVAAPGETNPNPPQEALLALEYEADNGPMQFSPLGHRDAIPPRSRQRFPYPGSQVSSLEYNFPLHTESISLGDGNDWDPVILESSLPKRPFNSGDQGEIHSMETEGVADWSEEAPKPTFTSQEDFSLISALEATWQLCPQSVVAQPEDFDTVALPDTTRLAPFEAIHEVIPSELHRPMGGTEWIPQTAFPKATAGYRSPAINFPVLFQLGASLPQRPAEVRPN